MTQLPVVRRSFTYLMSAIMEAVLVTAVWFLAKILARGDPFHVNHSPYCLASLAVPLCSNMSG